MKTLNIKTPSAEYDIVISKGILAIADELIKDVTNPEKIMLVTDENVDRLYGNSVFSTLEKIAEVKKVVLPAGETTKSMQFLKHLYDEAFDFKMTRKDLIVALGGGVIGDLAGFCASTLFRGVDIIQIPTTLVAQVDSSVGGKTAIDVKQGKNLVGSFYQPRRVIIDTQTLKTLPDREFFGGLAEVIKYGAIKSLSLFEKIENAQSRENLMAEIDDVVLECCDIKRQVVEEDEQDRGLRMILNFGHTAGHIVEKAYKYTGYTHGEAVAFGMIVASRLGEQLEITENGTAKRIERMIKEFGLPCKIDMDGEEFLNVALDKKAVGKDITVILIEKIGKFKAVKMKIDDFISGIKKVWVS